MNKNALFFALIVAFVFGAIFLTGHDNRKLSGHQNFFADILTAVGPQKDVIDTSKDGANSTSAPTLADALQKIQNQEQLLTSQMLDIRSQLEIINLKIFFTRTMKRGDSGDDVTKLQELLEKIPEAYPPEVDPSNLAFGYYGHLTETAVKKLQEEEGLKQTGVADQDTIKKLYELSADSVADEKKLTEFTPTDFSTVADLQNLAIIPDQISQSSSTKTIITDLQEQISGLASTTSSTQDNVADLQNQILQLSTALSNMHVPTPALAPVMTPTTSSLAISNIQAAQISRTSATITWTTNNPSTSTVNYSQDSNLTASKTLTITDIAMLTNHSMTLTGLNPGTQYYYYVTSKNSVGTTATSAHFSFQTLH